MGSSSSTSRSRGGYPASRNRMSRQQSLTSSATPSTQNWHQATTINNSGQSASSPPAAAGQGHDARPTNPVSTQRNSGINDTAPASSQRNSTAAGRSGTNAQSNSSQPQRSPQAHSAITMHRPGAYSITRDGAGPTQVFRVQIPHEVRPGQEFQVIAGARTVRVRCPRESRGGNYLQITVPPEPIVMPQQRGVAVLTSATDEEGGGAVRMSSEARVVNEEQLRLEQERLEQERQELNHTENSQQSNEEQQQQQLPQPTTYMVTVPPAIFPGMQFAVEVEGQRMMVTCPPNVQAGMNLRILPPRPTHNNSASPNLPRTTGTSLDRPPEQRNSTSTPSAPNMMQMFEVVVPPGVEPNQSFSLLANGQRVLVTCPPNVRPGQKVRFQLPVSNDKSNDAAAVQLEYEDIKDGWARTIRVTDMKFQWVRMNEEGEIDLKSLPRFDVKHSAYTRKLQLLQGNDERLRTGKLSFGLADESYCDSSVESDGKERISYAEISQAHQRGTFEDKAKWFQEMCRDRLREEWNDGHIRILIRRQHLLHDSIEAVMSLSRDDFRKIWRFEFIGEIGIDAGGLAREWFQLVSEEVFNPDMGLWLPSESNQMAMRINPASEISCPDDHLIYFRFIGRVMGKALFEGQLISGHMVRHLYKHILGWPVMFDDLEIPDEAYYNSLKSLLHMDDVDDMCLDFTFLENALGENRVVELVEGGADKDVTNANLPEFMEVNLKYHMMERVRPQITELLLGFYDVIPEPLLTIFDFQELELLMSGLPEIDVDDWSANTLYIGQFEQRKEHHKVCQWFWEVVKEFDQETRARLLQFATGSAGVPSRGFAVLQGNDGNLKKFSLNGIRKDQSMYPRSHTCFNRVDLPCYSSKEEMHEKIKIALATSVTGFDIE